VAAASRRFFKEVAAWIGLVPFNPAVTLLDRVRRDEREHPGGRRSNR
jgi:hypothetical protein